MEGVMRRADKIWIKSMKIGQWLGCHQMACRSFSFRGYQFPLCARCTGVLLGEIAGIVGIIIGIRMRWYNIIAFILIMGLDWFIQYIKLLYSNNWRRVITGTLCGLGATYAYFYAIQFLLESVSRVIG